MITEVTDRAFRISVVEPDDAGGMAHFSFQLSEALAQAGHDVDLITCRGSEVARMPHSFVLREELRLWPRIDSTSRSGSGLARLVAAVRRVPRAGRLGFEWARLTRKLWTERPEVALFGPIPFPFIALYLAVLRRRGILLAQVCHEFERRDRAETPLRRMVERLFPLVVRRFDRVFVLSQDTREALLAATGLPSNNVRTIPHGNEELLFAADVDDKYRERYGLEQNDLVAVFFGRIRPGKGLNDLIQAMSIVPERLDGSRTRLLVAGSPTKGLGVENLRSLSESLELGDRVLLDIRYVPTDEVPSLMSVADVVVLPYHHATQSGVLHTAYTAGLPVIATDVGGLAEDVIDGETGVLVDPQDPVALAGGITRLLSDPLRSTAMGRRAKELSNTKHSWAAVAGVIEESLRGVRSSGADWSHEDTYEGRGPVARLHRRRRREILELFDELAVETEGMLADFGCSNGHLIEILQSRSGGLRDWFFCGFDHNERLLEEARARNLEHAKFEFVDLNQGAPALERGSFDIVTCFETMEHVGDYEAALEAVVHACRPGGHVVLGIPNEIGLPGLAKYLGRRLVRRNPYGDFFTNTSELGYLLSLLSGGRISRYREPPRAGWGPHLGFDRREFDLHLQSTYVRPGVLELLHCATTTGGFNTLYVLRRSAASTPRAYPRPGHDL